MPTYEAPEAFLRQYASLSREQRKAFRAALARFVADLRSGSFRAGLRVKGVRGLPGYYEMTWAEDGRAIFRYGAEVKPGEPHVIWYAIGTHRILP